MLCFVAKHFFCVFFSCKGRKQSIDLTYLVHSHVRTKTASAFASRQSSHEDRDQCLKTFIFSQIRNRNANAIDVNARWCWNE